jgi:hypothetical protein
VTPLNILELFPVLPIVRRLVASVQFCGGASNLFRRSRIENARIPVGREEGGEGVETELNAVAWEGREVTCTEMTRRTARDEKRKSSCGRRWGNM